MISLAVILSASFSQPTFAFTTGEKASRVIGQSSFTTSTCTSGPSSVPPSQSGLCGPDGSVFDSLGNLWVADRFNNRVIEFKPPFSNGESASLVIGQPNFTTSTCNGAESNVPPTQSGLCFPVGLAFDFSGNLWVADSVNSRVLEFNPPFSNGESASLVIGQSSFTISICSTFQIGLASQNGLCSPLGLAFDSSNNLWVADTGNSRVLEFNPPFSNGESASLVIGQSSFTTGICTGGPTSVPLSKSGLCNPFSLAFDSSGNLWVADSTNSRVLEFADEGHH